MQSCRWDYVELRGKFYPDMDRLAALEMGMKTWANWVDTNIDRSKTRVFFQSISPTHYKYGPSIFHCFLSLALFCWNSVPEYLISYTWNIITDKVKLLKIDH